jgi:outer membrane protein assembly factor BamB
LRAVGAAVALLVVLLIFRSSHRPNTDQSVSNGVSWAWLDAENAGDQHLAVDQQEVTVLKAVVIVTASETISARDIESGHVRWSHRSPEFTTIAGSTDDSVIVAGNANGVGFDALDPTTGARKWSNSAATDVLGLTDSVISAGCTLANYRNSCALVNQRIDGSLRWTVPIPIEDGVIHPPKSVRLEKPVGTTAHESTPRLVGVIINEKERVIFETSDGEVVKQSPVEGLATTFSTRSHLISVRTAWQSGACRYVVTGVDPATGLQAWERTDLDLETAFEETGCRQAYAPDFSSDVVRAQAGGRPVLLASADGKETAFAESDGPDSSILYSNGNLAVGRSAEDSPVSIIILATHQQCTLDGPNDPTTVLVAGDHVLIGNSEDVVAYNVDGSTGGGGACAAMFSWQGVGELLAAGAPGFAVSWGDRMGFIAGNL